MNSNKTVKKRKLPVFLIVLVGSIVALSAMIFFQPQREAIDPAQLPWNAHFDAQGKLQALGLTPGHMTVREAMKRYGKDVEIKLFSDHDLSNKSAEAYFPVVYIGSIKGSLALRLNVNEADLNIAFDRGNKISLTTSGSREVEPSNEDIFKFLDRSFSSVSLIPNNNLTEHAITTRFGQPDRIEIQSDNLPHWFYTKLGLELILDSEGPEALQYSVQKH